MPSLVEEAKSVLKELHVSPRKKFGQSFMVEEEALRAVAESATVEKGDILIEIGPGLGFLTGLLALKTERLVAVEKDRAFAAHLRRLFAGRPIGIVESDILKIDPSTLHAGEGLITVVGNIPYNITSPILEWLVFHRRNIRQAVLTVQQEVAERLAAAPGGKTWGALSIFIQVYSKVSVICKVGRRAFWPAPNVDSAVVKLDFTAPPSVRIENEEVFFRIVRRAFQKRRKTILNSLADKASGDFSKEKVVATLAKVKIDSMRRPETLTLVEWASLSNFTKCDF